MGRSGPQFNPIITMVVLTLGLLAAFPAIYYFDTRRDDTSGPTLTSCLLLILSAGGAVLIGGVQFILTEYLADRAYTDVPQLALATSLTGFVIITATLVLKQGAKIEFAPNLEQKVAGVNLTLYAVLWLMSAKAILYTNVPHLFGNSDELYGMRFNRIRINWAADLSVFALLSIAIVICCIWYRKTNTPAEDPATTTDASPATTVAGAEV